MEKIDQLLEKIHSHPLDSTEREKEVHEVHLKELSQLCLKEVREDQLGLVASSIFQGPFNLYKFLRGPLSVSSPTASSAIPKIKESIFKFISEWIRLLDQQMSHYALETKVIAWSHFRKEPSNIVKTAALKALNRLVHLNLNVILKNNYDLKEMAECLFTEFITNKKLASGTKGAILVLIGTFTNAFPKEMQKHTPQFSSILMETLEAQFRSSKPEFPLLTSCLKALRLLLNHYSTLITANPDHLKRTYKYISLSLELPPNVSRYSVAVAGLSLLDSHSAIVRKYLTEDSEVVFGKLLKLCSHGNKKLKEYSFRALDSFINQVSNEIMSGERNTLSDQNTFKYFIFKFHELLESSTSGMEQISIAVRGFGAFSAPIVKFMGVWELKRILGLLVSYSDKIQNIDFSVPETIEEAVFHLPSFFKTFSKFIAHSTSIEDFYLKKLEKLIGTVFQIFPRIWPHRQDSLKPELARLFISCFLCSQELFQRLLSTVIRQGLMCTFGMEGKGKYLGEDKSILWDYIKLWKFFLDIKLSRFPEFSDLKEEIQEKIISMIYDEFIASLINLFSKLDLSYTIVETAVTFESTLAYKNQKDYSIFSNLVEFSNRFLLKNRMQNFSRWIPIFSKEVIFCSHTYPAIPGFYQLFTLTLGIAEKSRYFEGVPENKQSEIYPIFRLFVDYLRDLVQKITHFKDETLVAVVGCILASPIQFLPYVSVTTALKTAFQLGLVHLPLSHTGLNTLEHYLEEKPKFLEQILPEILPVFNDHLLMTQEELFSSIESKTSVTHRFFQKDIYQQHEAGRVQWRMLRFLGKLGGKNISLVDTDHLTSDEASSFIVWDTTKHINFILPCDTGLKPQIFFDNLLPRICELAEHSNDRQTKVLAGELLHSLVQYLLGNSVAHRVAHDNLKKIYTKLFPVLLRLATDAEQVTKQLFNPLVLQLIHWYTKNLTTENEETMTLLDACMDAVSVENQSLRDFGALCIQEFFKYSLKNISKKQEERNPFNIKSIFKRLWSLAKHPNPLKRAGCAISLTKIAQILQSQSNLVDRFLFEILHNLIFSLRMSHSDSSRDVSEKISNAILEMAKIGTTHFSLLSKHNSERRVHATPDHFLEHIFKEIIKHDAQTRKVCIKVFQTFAPHLAGGAENIPKWLLNRPSTSVESLLHSFEIQSGAPTRLNRLETINSWFIRIRTCVECFLWAFEDHLIEPSQAFGIPHSKSKLFQHLEHFLQHFALIGNEDPLFHGVFNIERYQLCKFNVLIATFKFYLYLLSHPHRHQLHLALSDHFFLVFFRCAFLPSDIGLVSSQIEMKETLSALLKAVASQLVTLDSKARELFDHTLEFCLSNDKFNLLASLSSDTNAQEILPVIDGYILLDNANLLFPGMGISRREFSCQIVEKIFQQVTETKPNPTQTQLMEHLITLALTTGFPVENLWKMLSDTSIPEASPALIHQETEASLSLFDSASQTLNSQVSSSSVVANQLNNHHSIENHSTSNINNNNVINNNNNNSINNNLTDNNVQTGTKTASELFQQISEENSSLPKKQTFKGELFYIAFKHQIHRYMLKTESAMEMLLHHASQNSFFFRLLLNLIAFQHQTTGSADFLKVTSRKLHFFEKWTHKDAKQEEKEDLLTLMLELLKLNKDFMVQSSETSKFLVSVCAEFLGRDINFTFKVHTLELLKSVLLIPNAWDTLRPKLNEMVIYDFPTNSSDLVSGSRLMIEYLEALDWLLEALESNPHVLEILMPVFREKAHIHKSTIQDSLKRLLRHISDSKD